MLKDIPFHKYRESWLQTIRACFAQYFAAKYKRLDVAWKEPTPYEITTWGKVSVEKRAETMVRALELTIPSPVTDEDYIRVLLGRFAYVLHLITHDNIQASSGKFIENFPIQDKELVGFVSLNQHNELIVRNSGGAMKEEEIETLRPQILKSKFTKKQNSTLHESSNLSQLVDLLGVSVSMSKKADSIYIGKGDVNGTSFETKLHSDDQVYIRKFAEVTRIQKGTLFNNSEEEKEAWDISIIDAYIVSRAFSWYAKKIHPQEWHTTLYYFDDKAVPHIGESRLAYYQDGELIHPKTLGEEIQNSEEEWKREELEKIQETGVFGHAQFSDEHNNVNFANDLLRRFAPKSIPLFYSLSCRLVEIEEFCERKGKKTKQTYEEFIDHIEKAAEFLIPSLTGERGGYRTYNSYRKTTENILRKICAIERRQIQESFVTYEEFIEDIFQTDPQKQLEYKKSPVFALRAYREYIQPIRPTLAKQANEILSKLPPSPPFPSFDVHIPESARQRHTYITGGTGSGKTELMKVLVHEYVKRPDSVSVVLIDPQGLLANPVGRWKEFYGNDRLVFIEPFLKPDYCPIINPFEVKEKSDEQVDYTSQVILSVFEELLGGSGLSLQMETLLLPCIATVIRMGGTFRELQRFMLDDMNEDLIQEGLRSHNPGHGEFFRSGFQSTSYGETKRSIYTKIQSLLNTRAFYYLLVGEKSTVDLESLMDERKTIIFNLASEGTGGMASDAIGRFILAAIQSIAFRRLKKSTPPVPTHIFVDECQLFITKSVETILTRARAFGLHLTLAQQILGQDMNTQLKRIVMANTAIKCTGKSDDLTTLKTMVQATGAELADLQKLSIGKFSIKLPDAHAIPVQIPTHLLDNRNTMSEKEWETTKKSQIKRYYRSIKDHPEEPKPSPPSGQKSKSVRKPKFSFGDE
jgi:Helicase HerA, central domain